MTIDRKIMRNRIGLRIIIAFLLIECMFMPTMSGGLTTFGKSNPQNQHTPPPPPTPSGKTRECKMTSECAGIQNTSCMADPRDGRNRCLCGDYSAPLNGLCNNKFKALHTPCSDDLECIEGAQCIQHNNTMGKRCYCREGYYQESLFICSGCSSIFSYTTTLLAASLMLGRLN